MYSFIEASSDGDAPARLRNKRLIAINAPVALPSHEEDDAEVAKPLAIANSKVKESTASLDLLLGYAVDMELELVARSRRWKRYR